jgi:hypothetical protein
MNISSISSGSSDQSGSSPAASDAVAEALIMVGGVHENYTASPFF